MSGAVIVEHKIPGPGVEVIPTTMGNDIHAVVLGASAVVITDAASKEQANAMAVRLHLLSKVVEGHIEGIKKPLNGLLKAVREVESNALDPLAAAKKRVLGLIATYDAKVAADARKAAEAVEAENRKRIAEAEAERQRLQKIANDEHKKQQDALAAQAAADAEEAAALGIVAPAAPVIAAPVIEAPKVELVKPVIVAPTASAATTRKMPKLVIDEEHPVWCQFHYGSESLITVNRAAVKRVLDSGVRLPWARIEMVEEVAMTRGS